LFLLGRIQKVKFGLDNESMNVRGMPARRHMLAIIRMYASVRCPAHTTHIMLSDHKLMMFVPGVRREPVRLL